MNYALFDGRLSKWGKCVGFVGAVATCLTPPSKTHGQDKYGRTLADVFLLDGTHVNHTLVKDGWCWWYRKYAPRNRELERLEKEAREAKKGLWVAPTQVPPWEWRGRK